METLVLLRADLNAVALKRQHHTARQRGFASAQYADEKKRTRREAVLSIMERIAPWARPEATIAPSSLRSGRVGRTTIGVTKMLHMYRRRIVTAWPIKRGKTPLPHTATMQMFLSQLQDNDLTKTLYDQERQARARPEYVPG